jgi:hypothetical protein
VLSDLVATRCGEIDFVDVVLFLQLAAELDIDRWVESPIGLKDFLAKVLGNLDPPTKVILG